MPENETLIHDSRSASRWSPFGERIDRGQSPTELFPELQDSFYAALRRAWKQWKGFGIDPQHLFQAALSDPNAFRELIRQSANDRNAQLLRDVAAERHGADMERLICGFLNAAWEGVEGVLQVHRREDSRSLEFSALVNRMLDRIARSLVSNPSRFPKRPSREKQRPDLDVQLGESLL